MSSEDEAAEEAEEAVQSRRREDAEVDALVLGEPWWLYQRDAVT